ncbi:MAG: hypothetical protein LBT05_06130 [Planctomycetaceae bacterium]|jgi:hypothetical protein|nr:hypothetical protein [Planctomycetaceae bacterium]
MVNLEKRQENQSVDTANLPKSGMSVWNKVLFFLLILCTAGFVYLGTVALNNTRSSQKKLVDLEKSLKDEQEKNKKLLYGNGNEGGYLALNAEVNRLRKIQGAKAWRYCLPDSQAQVADTTVTLQLTVDALPEPANLADGANGGEKENQSENPVAADAGTPLATPTAKPQDRIFLGTTVYLFDKRAPRNGGAFLGVFTVSQINGNKATLTNSLLMTAEEITKINSSVDTKAPWAIYTALPIDSKALFENVEKDKLAEIMTEELTEIYADQNRELASLEPAFTSLQLKRMELLKHVDMLQRQLNSLEQIGKDAATTIDFYERESETIKKEIDLANRQKTHIEQLLQNTENAISQLKSQIEATKALIKTKYAELTKQQITASEKINQQNAALSMTP